LSKCSQRDTMWMQLLPLEIAGSLHCIIEVTNKECKA